MYAHSVKYADLRDFLLQLERRGELKRIAVEVDPRLEMTEICDRVLEALRSAWARSRSMRCAKSASCSRS